MEISSKFSSPHVLIFPFPAQGHINPMLKLAELLSISGFSVTFVNTHQNQQNLSRFTDIEARFQKYPGFQFFTIPDCLKFDQGTAANVLETVKLRSKPSIKQLLTESNPKINCFMVEGFLGFAADIAYELGIPVIYFRTFSACAFWSFFCIPDLIDAGELPIKDEQDMDRFVTKVPGMETFLRKRDLPSLCRAHDIAEPFLSEIADETRKTTRAQALILNTFEDLESSILSQIRNHVCPKTYSIGPLQELLKTIKARSICAQELYDSSSSSLLEEDRTCIAWLDKQPSKSVIYVSFGSVIRLKLDKFTEFWHGLVNSKTRFLWVIRPDSITNHEGCLQNIPEEFHEGCKENGYIVKWAPQEEVLAHKATGGFLTHCGWNSTLESIVAGVPMICWPNLVDQQINSRYVGEVWKLGLDMKDVCERSAIEKMVNDLMVDKREEYVRAASRMAELAKKSISEGGSSYCNLNHLIEDIRLMSNQPQYNGNGA